MAQGWIATNPLVNIGSGNNWTRQGAPDRIAAPTGIGEYSSSYSINNRYTGDSVNPATVNWPGVTVIVRLTARPINANEFPSVLSWVGVGEFYGGYMLSLERSVDSRYVVYWRAGDSTAHLTPLVYNTIPPSDEYLPGDNLTIVAGFDKATSWIVVNRNGSLSSNSAAHAFGWRNLSALHSVLGYFRSTNRTTPHAVSMAAAIPRDLRDQATDLAINPWQLFQPRRIWVPQSAISGLPTLSASTYKPGTLTASGWTPRITAS